MKTPIEIDYDPEKDRRNRAVRRIPLRFAVDVLENPIVTVEDTRHDYGEVRLVAYGRIGRRLHVCVYTLRGHVYRIISLRKANRREIRDYGQDDV